MVRTPNRGCVFGIATTAAGVGDWNSLSLCTVPRQLHHDLALLILLSDVQCCLSCSVLGIYVLTLLQQPSNQQHFSNAGGEVEERIPVVFSMYHW